MTVPLTTSFLDAALPISQKLVERIECGEMGELLLPAN